MNATFLVLIPKKGRVEKLKDFRPIRLVGGSNLSKKKKALSGGIYKWVAKVLAYRLKKGAS